MFYKKTVFKNFAIFTGKNLCWSLFLFSALRYSVTNVAEFWKHRNKTRTMRWDLQKIFCDNPVSYYLFKVSSRNTRTRCEIYSKLTIKAPKRRHWRRSGFFIVPFCSILYHTRFLYCTILTLLYHIVFIFLYYTTPCSSVSIFNFEQVNAGLELAFHKV